jgi:hypothetical protein
VAPDGATGSRVKLPLVDADRAAHSDAQFFDRGLVPLERSGWTLPGGVAPPYPALAADIDVGVLVVGAGLAGSSLALHLAEAGVAVAVLEARQPGWGASGRNAGHVLPTLRDPTVFERLRTRAGAWKPLPSTAASSSSCRPGTASLPTRCARVTSTPPPARPRSPASGSKRRGWSSAAC